jgi:dimethylglycine dehydrogenase
MSALPSHARVVIIAEAPSAASALYHLAKAGWTDCVLARKERADRRLHLARRRQRADLLLLLVAHEHAALFRLELYRGLATRWVDYPMNYHVTGSLRLGAYEAERMQEFQRAKSAWAATRAWTSISSSASTRSGGRKYPFLETHEPSRARSTTPSDGDIDPAQLTQALAEGRARHGRENRPLLPGDRRAPRGRRMGDRHAAGRHPLRDRWSTPPVTIAPPKSAHASAATCR